MSQPRSAPFRSHSVILRPTPGASENAGEYVPPTWFKVEHRGKAPRFGEEESAPTFVPTEITVFVQF